MEQKEHTGLPPATVLQHLPEAVIATDKKWVVTFTNPAADELTGLTGKSAAGKNLAEVIKLFSRDKNTEMNPLASRTFMQDRKPCSFLNCIIQCISGNRTPVDVFFAPLSGPKGPLNGYIVVIHDITERAKLDEEFINKQKIEAIANIAGGLAHDFTNSLGVITGHASSIADNLIPKTRAHEEALRILESSKHCGNIVKHLMSIARIGSTKTDMKVEAVPLDNIVKDAVNIMEESFASHKISFKIRNSSAMSYVMADDRQMLDCLVNLLLNSTEAMPDGGTVTIDAVEATFRKTSYVALRIRDNGRGMPNSVLKHVFDPFFTTKAPGLGAGLGLTVVMNSLQRWGGFIKIRSRPQQGTSIRLFLRKAKEQPARDTAKGSRDIRETILFVDDSAPCVEKYSAILKEAGYNVYAASGGLEGIDIYRKRVDEIDLSIIDLVMPGTDGRKVLEEILAFNPTASIIMSSGFSRDYVRTSLERGAWGFIQKPFSPDHFLTTVRKMLDQNNVVKSETHPN